MMQNPDLRNSLHLLILCHIIQHRPLIHSTGNLDQDVRCKELLDNVGPPHLPFFLDRQMKLLFAQKRSEILHTCLRDLHGGLRKSQASIGDVVPLILILALSLEYIQREMLCLTAHTNAEKPSDDGVTLGKVACSKIEEQFKFITELFRMKYRHWTNAIRGQKELLHRIQGLSQPSKEFLEAIASLTENNCE
jgi:hypothetical protein